MSDGLFHAFGFVVVSGLYLLADLRRHRALVVRHWVGGLLLGAGGFQLYDGLGQHKILGIDQIRYGVDLLPYDLTWDLVAVALLLVGAVLTVRPRRARPAAA